MVTLNNYKVILIFFIIDIVNCLYMKDLALVNPEEGISLHSFLSFYGRQIPKIRSDILAPTFSSCSFPLCDLIISTQDS